MKNFHSCPGYDISENYSSQRSTRLKNATVRICRVAVAPTFFFLMLLSAGVGHAQSHDVVCREGVGDFTAEFPTGVRVRVGPIRNEELEARVCEETLSWGDQNLRVADSASHADIEAFRVELGLSTPVVALQVKNSKAACCMEYKIYSLRAPPVLLHTITG